jgi:hypothetical protein
MLAGDCDAAISLPLSGEHQRVDGGFGGLPAISCAGCHGRAADGTGAATVGYGAGLRQRHWRAGTTDCVNCHSDSNPANKTVVGENVRPPYYGSNVFYPAMPTDPCNPSPTFTENFKGTTIGLDNDGNGQFDMADSACGAVAASPARVEAVSMLVTAYDKLSGALTVSYGAASATTTTSSTGCSRACRPTPRGQVCAIGTTGTATFTVPNGSFFLVVADDATNEARTASAGRPARSPSGRRTRPAPPARSHRTSPPAAIPSFPTLGGAWGPSPPPRERSLQRSLSSW